MNQRSHLPTTVAGLAVLAMGALHTTAAFAQPPSTTSTPPSGATTTTTTTTPSAAATVATPPPTPVPPPPPPPSTISTASAGSSTPPGGGTSSGPAGGGATGPQGAGDTLPAPPANPTIPATPPRRSDYLDTRITWTFGDDDILTSTGQRVPVSPLPRIGDRPQYQLFFDALNSRFAGRENLTHLTLYARAPGFIPRVQTEAALVLRLDLGQLTTGSGNLNQAFYDAGTYIRLLYQTNPTRPNDGFSMTFFPFDTDRFRIGYLWDLSWGGNDIFPRRVGAAPGLRVGFDSGPLSIYAGFKTAGIVVPLSVVTSSADIDVVRVEETQYGVLGGVGYQFSDMARLDISGGYFQQGSFDFPGVRGQPVYVGGASARFALYSGLPPSTSIDMQLYRNHPDYPMQIFRPEVYTPGSVQWSFTLEGTGMAQNLADITTPGRTSLQPGFAGAAQFRVRAGYLGVGLTGLFRDVPFLLRNVPSFIPFQTIPPDASVSPEYFVAASVDYGIPSAHLIPALIAGVQVPATFSTTVTEGTLQSERALVIRRAGNFSILPPGQGAVPIISTRASLRWDLSSIMAFVFWVQYVRDPNATLLAVDPSGARQVRVFQTPDQLGFGMTAQARF